MYKPKGGRKPTFSWVPAPDGQMKLAMELFDHCLAIQSFYRRIEGMDSERVRVTCADEIAVLRELAIEKDIKVLGPQWFASLF